MGSALVAIVDDDPRVRKALQRLFRLARYDAHAFGSAMELMESLRERTPSCVVLDLHIPGISGLELLRRFSTMRAAPPVVVITADDRAGIERECLALGSKGFFMKPVDCGGLLAAVEKIVAQAPA